MTDKPLPNLAYDKKHIWHPYSALGSDTPVWEVVRAKGAYIYLSDGTKLLDGMASWWSTIHGYNHSVLNEAARQQQEKMAHVMFGGFTHEPAIRLAQRLIEISPPLLDKIFFADSGSVAMEVALKMAMQYWQAQGNLEKQRFLTVRGGYHGDTWHTMSICDPQTGMHSLYSDRLPKQFFAPRPACRWGKEWQPESMEAIELQMKTHHEEIAAVVLEPIVQGAGGMYFYHAEYLNCLRALCDKYNLLLIFDEIATGFGRTGKLFAVHHTTIQPDIMAVGKALTGGHMTLAAVLTTETVAQTIASGRTGVLMHGPTFMANPLACAVALASVELLLASEWQSQIFLIEQVFKEELLPLRELPTVKDVRVLGGIGVVELHEEVDIKKIEPLFVERGIWLRPFGRLVYAMPPYILTEEQLRFLATQWREVLEKRAD